MKKPNVIIEVSGGVCTVVKIAPGTLVEVRDFDEGECLDPEKRFYDGSARWLVDEDRNETPLHPRLRKIKRNS